MTKDVQRGIKLPIYCPFFKKIVILGFYAGKSHNLIGLGIFHGDLDFFDLHEKSLDLSNYEIFPNKILKSRTFKKSSILIVKTDLPSLDLYAVYRARVNYSKHRR